MQVSFSLELLTDERGSEAFPLVQASHPDLQLPAWQAFVRFYNSQAPVSHTGVMAMRDGRDGICGVFAYRVEQELRNGLTFSIQLFVASDILNSRSIVRALVEGAEASASKLGCQAVEVRTSNDQAVLNAHLVILGFSRQGYLSSKPLTAVQLS